jgi:TldD protein
MSLPGVAGPLVADARRLLLAPAGLDDAHLSRVLASIHTHDVDFADLYFQYSRMESWNLEEGIVKSGAFNIDGGVGIRAVRGDKQAFAYSDDITLAALEEAAIATRAIGRQGGSAIAALDRLGTARTLYAAQDPVGSLPEDARVALLERLGGWRASAIRRHAGDGVLAGEYEAVLVAPTTASWRRIVRPLVRVAHRHHRGAGGASRLRRWRQPLRLRLLRRCDARRYARSRSIRRW